MANEITSETFKRLENNPASWFEKAKELYFAAKVIECGENLFRPKKNKDLVTLSTSSKDVSIMLYGNCIEVLLKRLTVLKKGRYEKGHNLIVLAKKANFFELLDKEEVWLLEVLTEAIVWFGRYHLPIKLEDLKSYKSNLKKHGNVWPLSKVELVILKILFYSEGAALPELKDIEEVTFYTEQRLGLHSEITRLRKVLTR